MEPTAQNIDAAFVIGQCRPVVRSLARKLVRDRSRREDAEQEGYMRIIRRLPQYDPAQARLTTWAYVVARSAILDYLRREARAGDVLHIDDEICDDQYCGCEPDPAVTVEHLDRPPVTPLRTRIIRYYRRHPDASKRQVCRAIGCDRDTVRLVRREMLRAGFVFTRSWSNQYAHFRKAA